MKCGNTPHRKVTDINDHILIQTTTFAKGNDIIADIFDSRQYKFQSALPTSAMTNSQSIANFKCYDFNSHRLQQR